MGCGLSNNKIEENNLRVKPDNKPVHVFSLRKHMRINPKYMKLSDSLFRVQEASPSRELSFVTVSFIA